MCVHIYLTFFSVLPHSHSLPLLLLHYLFIMYANAFNCMDSGSTKRGGGREEREREGLGRLGGIPTPTSNNLHILACNEICNNSAINCVRVLVYGRSETYVQQWQQQLQQLQ